MVKEQMGNDDMTTGRWFRTLVVLSVPLVNVIMLMVWSFGKKGNRNRQTFCRGFMLYAVLYTILVLIPLALALYTVGVLTV